VGVAGSDEQLRTEPVKNLLDPIWKHEVQVAGLEEGGSLEFCVWDSDPDGKDEVLGKVTLEGARFREQGFSGELELQEVAGGGAAFLRVKIAVDGKPPPAGPEREFTVVLENPKKKAMGIDVEIQDARTLYVTAVKNGPIHLYNKEAEPARQLLPGDYIVKINDVEGNAVKLDMALKKQTSLNMVCRRADEWRAAVDKGSKEGSLGLEFVKPPKGSTIVITNILAGAVERWNEECPERAVKAGDRILAINGKRSKPADMLKKCKASAQLTLTLARPAVPEEEGEPRKDGEEPAPQ